MHLLSGRVNTTTLTTYGPLTLHTTCAYTQLYKYYKHALPTPLANHALTVLSYVYIYINIHICAYTQNKTCTKEESPLTFILIQSVVEVVLRRRTG